MAKERAQWTGRLGFILAATGSAIGLGNLWKFPYITYENNGGAFVLVYLAAIAMVGVPIMLAEILLGRRSQKNPVGAFRVLAHGKPGGKFLPGEIEEQGVVREAGVGGSRELTDPKLSSIGHAFGEPLGEPNPGLLEIAFAWGPGMEFLSSYG